MGWPLGEERSSAYEHGHRMVVRGASWAMAVSQEGWPAQEESHTCDGDSDHRMGDERASAGAGAQHACAYCVWVYVDDGRGKQDCGDCVYIKG